MPTRGDTTRRWVRLCGVVGIGCLLSLLPTAAGAAQDPPATLPALQVVVLVDQSGSLTEDDVLKEKEAARTIAFSVLAPGSVVSVVGFGSSEKDGQSAVEVACPPTVYDTPQKRDSLATCIGSLDQRTDAEGDGTDHVAALQQALDFVRSGGPDKKVVFLLTDGKLDVSDSPHWGDTAERRNSAAAAKVKEVLADLDGAGAQVWPLGFGKVDNAALRDFAKGQSCTPAAPNPHEQIAPNAAELTAVVANAFSSASCVKIPPPDTGKLPQGGSLDLHVDIPAVASDASIVVYKRDPRVLVEYRAPGAGKPAPDAGGSHFEFAGQSTETESVRITDPAPGQWTVRLSSADVPAQDVAATVVYQAAVKAYLSVTPPAPAAGQTVDIDMQVWARGQAVTDPATLQGLSFLTNLTGSAGFPAQQVELTDADSDGTFSGQLRVPDGISGNLTFTGQVTGIGIGGDTRVLATKVPPGPAAVQAQILFDTNRAAVTPGGTVSGTISVTNTSGQPVRLRLDVAEPAPRTTLTVEPAVIQAGAGASTTPFTLRFGADTALGANAATLRLVDDANPTVVVAERLFATQVAPEPGIVEKLLWLWVVLAVLLVGLLVLLLSRLRTRNEARTVRGLKAQLLRGGFVTSEVDPRDPNSKVFGFVLHEDFTGLQLQQAGPGEPNVYEVRRAGPTLSLTPPGQVTVTLMPGERRDIGQDLAVAVVDERGMASPGTPITGPVTDLSFNPFDNQPSAGSAPAPPVNPSTHTEDPFASSHGDPFATTAAPTPPPSPGRSPYQTDPFGDDAFGNGSSGAWPTPDPSQHGPAPTADGPYSDPNNPFR